MALDYEFAPIDVNITTHPKAFRAGVAAMGLWLWGQAHAKQQRTGGRLTRAAVLGAWGGRHNAKLAAELVAAELWIAVDDGWEIFNFERKGPGSRGPSKGPAAKSTERVRRHRERSRGETETLSETVSSGGVSETSASVSNSVSVSSPDLASPPDWFGTTLETIAANTGVTLAPGTAWLRYAGHRASKRRPASPPDALYWLTTVMVREAMDEREKLQHRADREAKWDQERKDAPPKSMLRIVPDTPPAPYHGDSTALERERDDWERTAGPPDPEAAERLRRLLG